MGSRKGREIENIKRTGIRAIQPECDESHGKAGPHSQQAVVKFPPSRVTPEAIGKGFRKGDYCKKKETAVPNVLFVT